MILNSVFYNITAQSGNGGAIYIENDIKVISSNISHCSALNGKGGVIYSAASPPETTFNIHSEPNVVFSGSYFSHNRAISSGMLYVSGHYNHHMEFNYSTFTFNEAIGGGGVAFMRNTSLSITNSVLSNNMVTTDGGVLDLSFSSVNIQQSSLSQNTAVENGGVFYGQNYSTNITVVQTLFSCNMAANGGVFYVRRFNSNIKLVNSTFIANHATNQGGIMDIRGVTAVIDKDTIITNNSANISGDVISACLSAISAYGLEVQLDPTYPTYCSIYDGVYQSVTSVPADNPNSFTTAVVEVNTTTQVTDQRNTFTDSTTPTTTEESNTGVHNGAEIVTNIQTKSSPLFTTSTSSDATSDAPKSITVTFDGTGPEWWINANTNYDKTASTQKNPLSTSEEEIMTTGEVGTKTQLGTTMDLISSSDHGSSMTKSSIAMVSSIGTDGSTESISTIQMIPRPHDGTPKAIIIPTLDSFTAFQAHEDDYHAWTSSQHDLFRVAIILSSVFLCAVCIAVCVIMAVLIFMACKKRSGNVRAHGYYKRMPLTDKGEHKTNNEIKEHPV